MKNSEYLRSLSCVISALDDAVEKHSEECWSDFNSFHMLALLSEEYGEVAQLVGSLVGLVFEPPVYAYCDEEELRRVKEHLYEELSHVAVVCLRWMHQIESRKEQSHEDMDVE